MEKNSFKMTFKTFSVRQLLNGRRKTVPGRWASKGEAALAEFQPRSRLLVAKAAGGAKSCTTAEVGCGSDTVRGGIIFHNVSGAGCRLHCNSKGDK